MDQSQIRDFCIIAHVDHGKSTLADRFLEITETIPGRRMTDQVLDTMDLEREKGVTIKASAVRMLYHSSDGKKYELNLIDTPGHVDFAYEVNRSLAACEGAVLVVDAAQGVEAQTIANLYAALAADLEILPVINKIDLPVARPDEVALELADLLGVEPEDVLRVSAKEGWGVEQVLEEIVRRLPLPRGVAEAPLRGLVFDSHYDPYKGVVVYVRIVDGSVTEDEPLCLMASGAEIEPIEVGVFGPEMKPTGALGAGAVGYVATGLKSVLDCRVGDTLTSAARQAAAALPGYIPAKPMVFAGLYPVERDDYAALRDALERLQLNDASLVFEPESSQALQFGFRCGFLGLFHMEIIQERLEREYGLNLIATAPSVAYEVELQDGQVLSVSRPSDWPEETIVEEVREPWMDIQVFTPAEYIGPVMEVIASRRGTYETTEYLDASRVILHYKMPLAEVIVDLHDRLKSITRGYASLDYALASYQPGDMVKLEVLVNKEPVDALSLIVHRDKAQAIGSAIVRKMRAVIPRQLFKVPIQAALGGRIIARATVSAKRKDVLAKCYGGDVTRKRKLLEKQKAGKKRMKQFGQVSVPQEAFLAVLKLGEE